MKSIFQSIQSVTVDLINKAEAFQHQSSTFNAFLHRLIVLLEEFQGKVAESLALLDDHVQLRESLSILYRNFDMTAEMNTMLKRTSQQNFDLEVKSIQQSLTELVPEVVRIYGKYETLYIITPGYQQTSSLWK